MFNTRPWLYYDSQYTNKFTNTYIQGILDICGNIVLRNGGFSLPGGDVSMNGNLYVGTKSTLVGDVSMNRDLQVGKQSTLIGDVSMNGNLYVGLDASFNRNVSIKGISTFNNGIYQIDGSYNINIASSVGTFPNYGTTNIGSNLINVGSGNYNLVSNGLRDSIAIGNTILNNANPTGYGIIGMGKNVFPALQRGFQNIGIGNAIATSMTIGHNNVFIGNGVATNSSSTGNTVAIGTYAGSTNTTGINNTFIGAYTDANAGNYNNSTAIGYGTTITKSNQIKLGQAIATTRSETTDISGVVNFSGVNFNVNGGTSGYGIITTNYFKRYYIVGFSVARTSSNTATLTSGAIIPFYTTGNTGYNSSTQAGGFDSGHIDGTGTFIAPVNGVYVFNAMAMGVSGIAADNRMRFIIGTTSYSGAATYASNNDLSCTLLVSLVVSLNAGSSIYLQVGSTAVYLTYINPKCVASGFLLQNL